MLQRHKCYDITLENILNYTIRKFYTHFTSHIILLSMQNKNKK